MVFHRVKPGFFPYLITRDAPFLKALFEFPSFSNVFPRDFHLGTRGTLALPTSGESMTRKKRITNLGEATNPQNSKVNKIPQIPKQKDTGMSMVLSNWMS